MTSSFVSCTQVTTRHQKANVYIAAVGAEEPDEEQRSSTNKQQLVFEVTEKLWSVSDRRTMPVQCQRSIHSDKSAMLTLSRSDVL